MRYPHILSAIRSAKWAVQPATLHAIRDVLSARLRAADALSPIGEPADDRPEEPVLSLAPVTIIPIHGIIGKYLSGMESMCGGCDLAMVEQEIAVAMAAPQVRSIVLHINSPGGTVSGVPELAAKLRAWSTQKPIYAFTDSLMASAAYWLASACTGVFCTVSAEVGSIGVYIALVDESKAWEKEGYELKLVKAGERKAEGIPGSPITSEQVAHFQAEVDAIYAMFTGDVRAARPGVADETMQGQCFMGAAALAAGLVDAVASDIEAIITEAERAG